MTTIMMPSSIESSIREMCSDAISQAVSALAEKYGFDADEAARFLADSEVKIVRKRGPVPKSEPKVKLSAKAKLALDKPKRAKTGYLVFADFIREDVRQEMESKVLGGEKLKPQDVVREIAQKWKLLSKEEQVAWSDAAKAGESCPEITKPDPIISREAEEITEPNPSDDDDEVSDLEEDDDDDDE